MRQPQALARSWHKSAKARSASSAALLDRSTRLKRPTPLQNWNVSPLCGPLLSSFHTSWPCHSRYIPTITPCNGLRQCGQGRHSSTAGQQSWKSTTLRLDIGQGRPRPMLMVSAGCRSILHLQKMCSSTFASLKTRKTRKLAKELHSATHLGGQALWKLFRDRYDYKAGRRICLEVAQSCPQCQMGSDYGHRQKTTGPIQSRGPWDTLSIDIVGPLPADHCQEVLIVFVDCYSRYTILVPSSNHTSNTVSEALLRVVVPYFGMPRRLLSDRGREFVSEIWSKLLSSLGIQRVLTSPYHPEGNAINERSHRTLNNMLRARLLEGSSTKAWVDKVPGIMLSLNAMPHEPHGFSASMVATGREPTFPPAVQQDVPASPAVDDPPEYVEAITQRLQMTHQQMASPSPPSVANAYQEGSLIFTMTTPPERASKLSPWWKGPFRVCRIPNDYQIVYEDGEVQRNIHVNHGKPAKFTAPGLPEPMPAPETPRPPFGYLPAGLLGPRPPPPASAAPAGDSSSSSATASTGPQSTASAKSEMQPPATAPAN